MIDSKWISGLKTKMPLQDAAAIVLPIRLKAVLHHLPLAVQNAARDIEHVHQLRVATRRMAAALRLFSSCMPEKSSKRLRKRLRELRRSAGAARDWDVFDNSLQTSPLFKTVSAQPALDFLQGLIASKRSEAQIELAEVGEPAGQALASEIHDLESANSMKSTDFPTVGDQATHSIAILLRELDKQTSTQPASYERFHQVRILGKRLRYSMEIFVDCFDSAFRDQLYPAIEEMQEILGHITDAHVFAERLVELREHMKAFQRKKWTRYQKPIEQFLAVQRRVLPRERKRFRTWQTRWNRLITELPMSVLVLPPAKSV